MATEQRGGQIEPLDQEYQSIVLNANLDAIKEYQLQYEQNRVDQFEHNTEEIVFIASVSAYLILLFAVTVHVLWYNMWEGTYNVSGEFPPVSQMKFKESLMIAGQDELFDRPRRICVDYT